MKGKHSSYPRKHAAIKIKPRDLDVGNDARLERVDDKPYFFLNTSMLQIVLHNFRVIFLAYVLVFRWMRSMKILTQWIVSQWESCLIFGANRCMSLAAY